MWTKLIILAAFSLAFAYDEAAIVAFARWHYGFIQALPENFSTGNFPAVLILGEQVRETMTLVILLTVGYLSGVTLRQKLAGFLISFSLWMIFYYVFLKLLIDWPKTLWDLDVYMLAPVTRIGPVIYPLAVFFVGLVLGLYVFKISFTSSSETGAKSS